MRGIRRDRKRYLWYKLRLVGHAGISAAVWRSRHHVLKWTLHNACVVGDAILAELLAQGASQQELDEALWTARLLAHAHTVEVLVRAGAAGHYGSAVHSLERAAALGHAQVVVLLLAEGANPRAGRGRAMYAARRYGHAEVVALLRAAQHRWNLADGLGE